MSDKISSCDAFINATQLRIPLKDLVDEPLINSIKEDDKDAVLHDDMSDESSSSYCTALCSLSEYDEPLEDKKQTLISDTQQDTATTEASASVHTHGGKTPAFSIDSVSPQEFSTGDAGDSGTSAKMLSDASSCEESSRDSPPLKSESKHLPPSSEDVHSSSSDPTEDLNLTPADAITLNDQQERLISAGREALIKPWDYFRGKVTLTDCKIAERFCSPEPRFTLNPLSVTPEGNRCNQERGWGHSGIKPRQEPTPEEQSLELGPSGHRVECRLYKKQPIQSYMEGEGHGTEASCRKEQTELSVRTRNRKASASCIATLTANKQRSGIPPRCYSERILATGQQHQPHSPPDSRRLQKQSRQGVWQSGSLPQKLSDGTWQHISVQDRTGRHSTRRMGTKFAETNSEFRDHTNLPLTSSFCPEVDYLDVFNSSCRSSTQMPTEGSSHSWSDDVLFFKLPMAVSLNNHNTSVCSEASSFECIDVALESLEEIQRGTKTVPKRQIQLKRRDTSEPHTSENNEKSQVPNVCSRPRDLLTRQHSTPAAFHQESQGTDRSSAQAERKQRLQKSVSLDETSSKTKMASCIITNILSKKMQFEQNLRGVEVPEKAFAPIKVSNNAPDNYLLSSPKDLLTDTANLNCSSSSQSPSVKVEAKAKSNIIKEHLGVSAKTQPKPLCKHSFNPLLSGTGNSDFPGSSTEITAAAENEKAEKLSPKEEVAQLMNCSSGERLSCDSAKGRARNTSSAVSKAASAQAPVKTTPEECHPEQPIHKQPNDRTQPLPKASEKLERLSDNKVDAPSPTKVACQISEQEASVAGTSLPLSAESSSGQEQENDRVELKLSGLSVNTGMQGKFKAMGPVHIVRDVRSLVKNTYNLSFRAQGETTQGLEDNVPLFQPTILNQASSKGESKGRKQDEKPPVRKVTPPFPFDRVKDTSSPPRRNEAKAMTCVESHDNSPSTKVSSHIMTTENSCTPSKSLEGPGSSAGMGKFDTLGRSTNFKQANNMEMTFQNREETSADSSKPGFERGNYPVGEKKEQQAAAPNFYSAVSLYASPASNTDQLDSCKLLAQMSSGDRSGQKTPGLPPRSQSSSATRQTPPSACVLTVAPNQMVSPYYYKPSPLGYQTIPSPIGTFSFMQGPVLLQPQPHSQPTVSTVSVPLLGPFSEDDRQPAQPSQRDRHSEQQSSPKQVENAEQRQKIPSPDTQQYAALEMHLGTENRRGSTAALNTELGGLAQAQNPRHLLLDPETGHYFYIDMPQLPQRKMLFDPQTCQYIEVLLPQQTLPSPVLPSPCALPIPPLHIPAMYAPHCLPYVHSHSQVLPPPGP